MPKYKIAWMPGDGVGNEVMDVAKIVLDACNQLRTLVMSMENETSMERMFGLITAKETATC